MSIKDTLHKIVELFKHLWESIVRAFHGKPEPEKEDKEKVGN